MTKSVLRFCVCTADLRGAENSAEMRRSMKLVIQRVQHAKVNVEDNVTGSIEKGLLVFIGIGKDDTEETADIYINKLLKLRIFEDENGKTNRSLTDVDGSLLLVSQFTLYADCKKGNRPSFTNAKEPEAAERIYEYFVKKCKEIMQNTDKVQVGLFGADMKVELLNDGPFTIVLDESIIQ